MFGQLPVPVDERRRVSQGRERAPDRLMDAQGVRILHERGELQVERIVRAAAGRQMAQLLQSQWRDIGVTVDIQLVPFATTVANGSAGQFDALALSWSSGADPDSDLSGLYHSGSAFNFSGYANPRLDTLLEQGRAFNERAPEAGSGVAERIRAAIAAHPRGRETHVAPIRVPRPGSAARRTSIVRAVGSRSTRSTSSPVTTASRSKTW